MKTIDEFKKNTSTFKYECEWLVKQLKQSAIEDVKELQENIRKSPDTPRANSKWASMIVYIKEKFNLKEEDLNG